MRKYSAIIFIVFLLFLLIVAAYFFTSYPSNSEPSGQTIGSEDNQSVFSWEDAESLDLTEVIELIEECKLYKEMVHDNGEDLSLEELEALGVPRDYWECALFPDKYELALPSNEDVGKLRLLNGLKIIDDSFEINTCEEVWSTSLTFRVYGANFGESSSYALYLCDEAYFLTSDYSRGPRPVDRTSESYRIKLGHESVDSFL